MIYAYLRRNINLVNLIYGAINNKTFDFENESRPNGFYISPIATLDIDDSFTDKISEFTSLIIKYMGDDPIINDFGDIHGDEIIILSETDHRAIDYKCKYINDEITNYFKNKFAQQTGNAPGPTEMEIKFAEAMKKYNK